MLFFYFFSTFFTAVFHVSTSSWFIFFPSVTSAPFVETKTTDMNKLLSVSPCVRADRSAVLQGTFWRCSFLWSRFEIWNIWFTITLSGRGVSYDAASLFVLLFMVVKYEFIFWETNKTKWSESPTDLCPPLPPHHHPPSWQRFSDVCPRSPANPPLVVTFGMSGRLLNPSYVRLGLMYVQMVWTAVGRSSAVVTLVVFILVILFIQKLLIYRK